MYGYCQKCFSKSVLRERCIDGNDVCEKGHKYKSCLAMNHDQVIERLKFLLVEQQTIIDFQSVASDTMSRQSQNYIYKKIKEVKEKLNEIL